MEIEDNSTYDTKVECVVPKIIHTSLMEGIFPLTPPSPPPPTSLEIPVKLHAFTKVFGHLRTPHPPGISNPFYGGSMDIFWNYNSIIVLLFIQSNFQFKNIAKTCLPPSMLSSSSIVHV